MVYRIAFVTILLLFTVAGNAFAAHGGSCDPDTEVDTDLGCFKKDDPTAFVTEIYSKGLYFLGGVAVLAIVYGAYLILSSQGNQSQVSRGKSYIVSAIIGIALAVSGFTVYKIIATDVLKIPGFE